MTEPLWFALIAMLCLAGWATTLVCFSRSLLPMANALNVCQKIVKQEDDKVSSLVERVMRKRDPQRPAAESHQRRPDGESPTNPMRIFDIPASPLLEQPDSEEGLEIVGA